MSEAIRVNEINQTDIGKLKIDLHLGARRMPLSGPYPHNGYLTPTGRQSAQWLPRDFTEAGRNYWSPDVFLDGDLSMASVMV